MMKRKMGAGASQDGRIENFEASSGQHKVLSQKKKKKYRSRNRNFQNGVVTVSTKFLKTAGYNLLIVTKSQCDLNSTKEVSVA